MKIRTENVVILELLQSPIIKMKNIEFCKSLFGRKLMFNKCTGNDWGGFFACK